MMRGETSTSVSVVRVLDISSGKPTQKKKFIFLFFVEKTVR